MTMVMAAAVMRGIGEAPFYGCIFTMLADVIEYGHWKTGIRVQALIFSAFTVGQKFGGGVAGWLVGQLMEASGFTGLAVEIPSAVSMVKNLYIYGNMIAWALVIILMLVYHLDKEYDGIMKDLTGRTA